MIRSMLLELYILAKKFTLDSFKIFLEHMYTYTYTYVRMCTYVHCKRRFNDIVHVVKMLNLI